MAPGSAVVNMIHMLMAPPWFLRPTAECWGSLNTAYLAGWKESSLTQHSRPAADAQRLLPLPPPTCLLPGARPSPVELRRTQADRRGWGWGPGESWFCVARVRSARGRCGAWVALGVVAERGRGPGLEAEQDGVVAREACGHLSENHRRAGTAGSILSSGPGN